MLTGHAAVEAAILAIRNGASGFLPKPFKIEELEAVLEKALERQALERTNTALEHEVARVQHHQVAVGLTHAQHLPG